MECTTQDESINHIYANLSVLLMDPDIDPSIRGVKPSFTPNFKKQCIGDGMVVALKG